MLTQIKSRVNTYQTLFLARYYPPISIGQRFHLFGLSRAPGREPSALEIYAPTSGEPNTKASGRRGRELVACRYKKNPAGSLIPRAAFRRVDATTLWEGEKDACCVITRCKIRANPGTCTGKMPNIGLGGGVSARKAGAAGLR